MYNLIEPIGKNFDVTKLIETKVVDLNITEV